MSDAVAHTLDGCEVQPLGEELNPEREELVVDMDVVRERGLEIINTTAYIAITGNLHVRSVIMTLYVEGVTFDPALIHDDGAIPSPAPHQRTFIGLCGIMCNSYFYTLSHF